MISTAEQRTVLHRYATGADLRSIAAVTNIAQPLVAEIVGEQAGWDRGRARRLVEDYDRANRPSITFAPAAPATPPPALKPAPVSKPEIVVTVTPEAEPSYESLLDRADRSGDPKLEKLAAKARELLDELEDRLTDFESAQEALAEIAELEAKLEEARSKLISRRPSVRAVRTGPDPKAVRAWAAANGVECNPYGRPPKQVVDQFLAAHASP